MTKDRFEELGKSFVIRFAILYAMPVLFFTALLMARSLTAEDRKEGAVKAPPNPPPPSKYAPANDLLAQVDYYIKRDSQALASQEEFDGAAKSRLRKDANTLAVLGLALALHDDENRLKAHAGEFVHSAQLLAKAGDFESAVAAFDELKKALSGEGSPAEKHLAAWEKVADLSQLMKQVPTINAGLKRGVSTPARLEKSKHEAAGHAAVLAAIAQASISDTHEVKDPADLEKWYQCCAEMRDAAGQVNAAVHAGDHAKTTSAMLRLANSCDTCHQSFRRNHSQDRKK
ncbi:MAG: hypothetical protein IT427_03210 [Pirellulales bacterium]|nr:hypothetical protein [Pirellulales bacterium]